MYRSISRGRSRPDQIDKLVVRDASVCDAKAINSLFNEAIGEGQLPWNQERTLQQTEDWLEVLNTHSYPCIVALENGKMIGCAAFQPLEAEVVPGHCVNYTVTLFCVVKQSCRKEGLGGRLFDELANHKLAEDRQYYVVICKILSINTAADHWLKSLDFWHCGDLTGIAIKNGQSVDERFYSKFLGAAPSVVGLGFPDNAMRKPLMPRKFTLPVKQSDVSVREAVIEDLPDMVGIFNHSILFELSHSFTLPFEVSERVAWFDHIQKKGLPCLVATIKDQVVGYMDLSEYDDADAFKETWFISVYLRPEITRLRIGQLLAKECLSHPALDRNGIKHLVSDVMHDNALGSGAALKLGFTPCVSISHGCYKFGQHRSWSFSTCLVETLREKIKGVM